VIGPGRATDRRRKPLGLRAMPDGEQ
jgi:hypothetical protein